MQYIEYEYAKKNKMVGKAIYSWLQRVPHLDIQTKGQVIKSWRKGEVFLNIGDRYPNLLTTKGTREWTKTQINKKYHNLAYQSAYLKQFFKI